MSNSEQSDAGIFCRLINLTFDIDADGAGTLVQQRKLWPVKYINIVLNEANNCERIKN